MKKVLISLSLICIMVGFFALGYFLRDIVPVGNILDASDKTSNADEGVEIAGLYYTEKGVKGYPSVLELRENGTCCFEDKTLVYLKRREGTWSQDGKTIMLFLPTEYDEGTNTTWEETTKSLHLVEGGLICDSYFFEKK